MKRGSFLLENKRWKNIFHFLFHIDHFIVTILAIVLLYVFALFTFNVSFMKPIATAIKNLSMSDVFFKIQNSTSQLENNELITIVDMTELTSRGDIGQLLLDINSLEPMVIGVDLIFEGIKDDLEGNLQLEEAIMEVSDKAIFAFKLINYIPSQKIFDSSVNSYFHAFFPISEAYANVSDNMSGNTIRILTTSQRLNNDTVYSFAAKIAQKMGVNFDAQNKNIMINYSPTSFPVISYKDIFKYPELIKNRIVLLGTMTEEADMHLSPLGKTPGIEIQAYSLLTLLEQKNIRNVGSIATWLIAFFLCYSFEIFLGLVSVFIGKQKPPVNYFLADSKIPIRIFSLLWLALLTFGAFVLFVQCGLYIDTVLILTLSALVVETRRLYGAIMKALAVNYSNRWIDYSLFK